MRAPYTKPAAKAASRYDIERSFISPEPRNDDASHYSRPRCRRTNMAVISATSSRLSPRPGSAHPASSRHFDPRRNRSPQSSRTALWNAPEGVALPRGFVVAKRHYQWEKRPRTGTKIRWLIFKTGVVERRLESPARAGIRNVVSGTGFGSRSRGRSDRRWGDV